MRENYQFKQALLHINIMDGETQSNRPEQAPLERFPPEVAEMNSKYHMDVSVARTPTLVCLDVMVLGSGEHG